jgi:hypothetical protein
MPEGSSSEEVQALRRSLRDLLALAALPALWLGEVPERMLESLADALARMLNTDIVYARHGSRRQPHAAPVRRIAHPEDAAALDEALEAVLRESETGPSMHQSSLLPYRHEVPGVVRLAVWPLGGDGSVLVVGTKREDFPTEPEHLLLRVAANQGTIALRSAQLLAASEQARATAEAALANATGARQ